MELIKDREFGGERPLFESHDLRLEHVIIRAGESAIKECSNIVATNCRFEGNYPFWHVHGFTIQDCYFAVGGRSALWYSVHLTMRDTVIDAPKMFREMNDIEIWNVEMNDADEVFWMCCAVSPCLASAWPTFRSFPSTISCRRMQGYRWVRPYRTI